ncbi:glycosyl transferase family 2 family protein [Asticcacaulis biprosthecium C19]|uniref:Glycosyl transferase family 2 family protein n=1 Tax=Asticcacaulis biprosthecium C19 TaxID=715226 RepID=F4QFX9_9CAUL|nr:glycosyltransferase family 2 protein [Asticcacaulis biprosthecium]EGF93790.1 glycosyl transferase family 2 family protein [Asticcacaulis biprosthecium C19]
MSENVQASTGATDVCVIIPTFRRPEGLKRALGSVAAQVGLDQINLSVIVCDNSPDAGARSFVEAYPIHYFLKYVHEPRPGVANARNHAVAVCEASYVAFLDDDEEAPQDWISNLVQIQERFAADVVFGPVYARLSSPTTRYDSYFASFFSRIGAAESEVLSSYYGCGNSLISRNCMIGPQPFSTELNDFGGEDDQLFHRLMQDGAQFAWAADAFVYEDVPPSRKRLSYTLRRAFNFGQGPSYTAAKAGKTWSAVAWMLKGLIQATVMTPIGLILLLLRRPEAAPTLDKAVRGLGKLIWFVSFRFYGSALLSKRDINTSNETKTLSISN